MYYIKLQTVDWLGCIPRWQFKFGKTYRNECGECFGEFDAMQQFKQYDKLGALAYPKPLSYSSDSNVPDYLNELQQNGCKFSCFSHL